MRKRYIFLIILLMFFGLSIYAQQESISSFSEWKKLRDNPKSSFSEVQKAFYGYWDKKTVKDISDEKQYKQFQRWEYYNERRLDVNGNIIGPEQTFIKIEEFNKKIVNKFPDFDIFNKYGEWKEVTPTQHSAEPRSLGLGRINCVAFDPTNSNIYYVGAATGGFWKTNDNGNTWTCLTNDVFARGVSAAVVDPSSSNTIYIGTGDRDLNYDWSSSDIYGVYKSTNQGLTWEKSKYLNGKVAKIIISKYNSAILFAATSNGLFKTTNGGKTWERISSIEGQCYDVEFHPTNSSVIYAYSNGLSGYGFYRSINGGDTWTQITNGLPEKNGRMIIGVSVNQPNNVYLLSCNGKSFDGLYLSTNLGESFSLQCGSTPNILGYNFGEDDNTGQGTYNLCMAVDPSNANIIYCGGINIWKSIDKGKTWKLATYYFDREGMPAGTPIIHADQHILAFAPQTKALFVGNDGGLFVSSNNGVSWEFKGRGLSITQAYDIAQSPSKRDWVLIGNQDNGTIEYYNNYFYSRGSGDGTKSVFDYSDTSIFYISSINGAISQIFGDTSRYIGGLFPSSESGPFLTPFILHKTNPNVMFVGLKHLWRIRNIKAKEINSIQIENISINPAGELNSNGLKFNDIDQSAVNTNILYVSANVYMWRSDNANAVSPTFKKLPKCPNEGYIKSIVAHPTKENVVYVIASNKVYKSTNKGETWIDISSSLPDIPLDCIVYDKNTNEGLYVGTDYGVWYKDSTMQAWMPFAKGLPKYTEINDLDIYYDHANPNNSILRAGTFGRGLWESKLFNEARIWQENVSACEGASVEINVSYNSSGEITYQWYRNSQPIANFNTKKLTLTNLSLSDAGYYHCKVTASGKISYSNRAKLTVETPTPLFIIPSEPVVCQGGSVDLTAGNYNSAYNLMGLSSKTSSHQGNIFDVVALDNIMVTGFSIYPTEKTNIAVFFRKGSSQGNEASPVGWEAIQGFSDVVPDTGNATFISFTKGVELSKGQTYAFYISSSNGKALKDSKGSKLGQVVKNDSKIILKEGYGLDYLFKNLKQPFVFNGRIHYKTFTAASSEICFWSKTLSGYYIGNPYTVSPTTSTKYFCSLIEKGSCQSSKEVLVTYSPDPPPNITVSPINATIAAGSSVVLTAGENQSELFTTMQGGNGHQGNMFDVTAKNKITITSFAGSLQGNTTVVIFYRQGSFVGHENNITDWKIVGSFSSIIANKSGNVTPIPIPINVTIPAGETYSFYITSTSAVKLNYTDGTHVGNTYCQDNNLIFKEGIGISYPFGTKYGTRIWNGKIYYKVENNNELSYLWNTNYTGSQLIVKPNTNSQYLCTAVDKRGCKQTSSTFVYVDQLKSSLADIYHNADGGSLLEMTIYPNPASDQISILLNSSTLSDYTIEIMSLEGKVIYQETILGAQGNYKANVNVASLPNGTYFCFVKSNSESLMQKLIVNHQNGLSSLFNTTNNDQDVLLAYAESNNYDNLVNQLMRASSIQVVSPNNGDVFLQSKPITFEAEYSDSQSYQLVILNNKEEVVFQIHFELGKYVFEKTLSKGLYYWKIESEDELLYVGKFYVR